MICAEEGDDLRKGTFVAGFCQTATWDTSPVVEFKLILEADIVAGTEQAAG
jgi:hypothetical protein